MRRVRPEIWLGASQMSARPPASINTETSATLRPTEPVGKVAEEKASGDEGHARRR